MVYGGPARTNGKRTWQETNQASAKRPGFSEEEEPICGGVMPPEATAPMVRPGHQEQCQRRQPAFRKWLASITVWQVNILSSILPNDKVSQRMRARLFRFAGARIGRGVRLGQAIFINQRHFHLLSIGDYSFINWGCALDLNGAISIGARVALGMRVSLITCTHSIGPSSQRASQLVVAPIHIADGAWIGAHAVIMPGVNIGKGSVVAAGAVVCADVPENTLVGGAPAKPLKHLDA